MCICSSFFLSLFTHSIFVSFTLPATVIWAVFLLDVNPCDSIDRELSARLFDFTLAGYRCSSLCTPRSSGFLSLTGSIATSYTPTHLSKAAPQPGVVLPQVRGAFRVHVAPIVFSSPFPHHWSSSENKDGTFPGARMKEKERERKITRQRTLHCHSRGNNEVFHFSTKHWEMDSSW